MYLVYLSDYRHNSFYTGTYECIVFDIIAYRPW